MKSYAFYDLIGVREALEKGEVNELLSFDEMLNLTAEDKTEVQMEEGQDAVERPPMASPVQMSTVALKCGPDDAAEVAAMMAVLEQRNVPQEVSCIWVQRNQRLRPSACPLPHCPRHSRSLSSSPHVPPSPIHFPTAHHGNRGVVRDRGGCGRC